MKPVIALLMILPLTACTGAGGGAPRSDDTAARFVFGGSTWQLQHVGKTAVPDDLTITATFADGGVSGHGGCNRYSASCKVDGDTLVVGPIGSTKMYCGPMETRFFRALRESVRWQRLDDGRLQLMRADGESLTFLPSS